jgi:hypothetical protein
LVDVKRAQFGLKSSLARMPTIPQKTASIDTFLISEGDMRATTHFISVLGLKLMACILKNVLSANMKSKAAVLATGLLAEAPHLSPEPLPLCVEIAVQRCLLHHFFYRQFVPTLTH